LKRIYNIIGLAHKAGKVSTGAFAAKTSLQNRKAKLLICSSDIAPRSKNDLITRCQKQNIPWIELENKHTLGACVGKAYLVAITINDLNLAKTVVDTAKSAGVEVKIMGVVEWLK
jgi:ribosomal protein L7Ae-like RNA K-turn-binding protein